MHYVCLINDNIVDTNSDPSQIFRIDCDASTTTKQTTIADTTTGTSNNVEHSSQTTTTSPHTTASLQSTTKRTKEKDIANDQITGNNIS